MVPWLNAVGAFVLGNDISGQSSVCCHLEAVVPGPLPYGPAPIAAGSGPGPCPMAPSARRAGMLNERPELLAEGGRVLGIQIDIHASTVQWSSGQCTVLPFLPKLPCSHHILNALESDTQFAEDLAKLPEAGLSSLLIVYLDKSTPKNALFKATYQALSLNKTLLIPTVFSLLWKV